MPKCLFANEAADRVFVQGRCHNKIAFFVLTLLWVFFMPGSSLRGVHCCPSGAKVKLINKKGIRLCWVEQYDSVKFKPVKNVGVAIQIASAKSVSQEQYSLYSIYNVMCLYLQTVNQGWHLLAVGGYMYHTL